MPTANRVTVALRTFKSCGKNVVLGWNKNLYLRCVLKYLLFVLLPKRRKIVKKLLWNHLKSMFIRKVTNATYWPTMHSSNRATNRFNSFSTKFDAVLKAYYCRANLGANTQMVYFSNRNFILKHKLYTKNNQRKTTIRLLTKFPGIKFTSFSSSWYSQLPSTVISGHLGHVMS